MSDSKSHTAEEDAAAKLKEERERVLNAGYALTHVRVQKLNALAERLETIMADDETFWQKEFKKINGDETEVRKFTNAVIKEYRDTLSDIADELGARSKRQDISPEPSTLPISILDAIEKIYGDSTEHQ